MKFPPLLALFLVMTALPASCATAAEPLKVRVATKPATLRAPAAAGPLRILLVDDDWSPNNQAASREQSYSDKVFRKLVGDAVGNDANAWDVETVKAYENGPGIERLRKYSVIFWYTGASYGGNPDNSAVLSIEDEKTIRRYLEEVGGAVVLVSPGYMSNALGAYGTWEKSNWPFLSEVVGIQGGYGMAQRFEAGKVTAADGTLFSVAKDTGVQPQFSAANPEDASVLFTTEMANPTYTPAVFPVATSHVYGKGRIVYVGFTLENVAPAGLGSAFNLVLDSTGIKRSAAKVTQPAVLAEKVPDATDVGPASVTVQGTVTTAEVTWTMAGVSNVILPQPGVATRKPVATPATQEPTVIVERMVPGAAPVRLQSVSLSEMKASDTGTLTPGRTFTYRVTITDRNGKSGFREADYTPPLPKDPASLTGTVQNDGSVLLTWPQVPGVTRYQIAANSGLTAPVIVNAATQWHSPPMPAGTRRWTVNSVYQPGGSLTAATTWPSVSTTFKRGMPTAGKMFLTQPSGVGNQAESTAHYRTKCSDAMQPGSLCKASGFLAGATNWEAAWNAAGIGQSWPMAEFKDLFDLGTYRRVNCVPPRNGTTVCWATTHWTVDIPSEPNSLTLIIMSGDRSFFANFEYQGDELPDDKDFFTRGGWTGNRLDKEHAFAVNAELFTGSKLDSQGRKGVPHACISCHGGTFDPVSRQVIGASLLPLVPGRLGFTTGSRGAQEEPIRRINQIILQSNPAPAIVEQINAMYNGSSSRAGVRANDAAIPPGWTSQPVLYNKVIAPYCSSCHFAQRGVTNFRTWTNLLQNKAAVLQSVCQTFTMPHSEILFRNFWNETEAESLPELLATSLGFAGCRQ